MSSCNHVIMSYHHVITLSCHDVITSAFHNFCSLLATFAIFWQLFGIFYNFRRLLVSLAFANYWYLLRISKLLLETFAIFWIFWQLKGFFLQLLVSFGNFCQLFSYFGNFKEFFAFGKFCHFWY